jgi:hypothetical protein
MLVVTAWVGAIFLYQNSAGGRNLLDPLTEPLQIPRLADYISKEALSFYVGSANFAFVSFGGLFGWSNIHIPWEWVKVVAFLAAVVGVGVCLFVYRHLLKYGKTGKPLDGCQKQILVGFLLAILFASIGVSAPVIVTQSPTWGIHSRYYFPAIVPIALYIFIGVRQLIPARIRGFLWPGWLTAWILYDAAIFIVVLLPYLYS